MDIERVRSIAGGLSLLASLLVLVYQQPLGEMLGGIGVIVLWMTLGALGVYLMGIGRD